MDKEKRVVFIQSQIACAMIEMESMKALNKEREMNGYSLAYDEDAFLSLIDKYGIGHNSVISYLMNY